MKNFWLLALTVFFFSGTVYSKQIINCGNSHIELSFGETELTVEDSWIRDREVGLRGSLTRIMVQDEDVVFKVQGTLLGLTLKIPVDIVGQETDSFELFYSASYASYQWYETHFQCSSEIE